MSNLKRYDGSNWQPIEIDADKLGGKMSSSFQDKITENNKLAASLVSGLATVATTGSYNDLTNKPDLNAYLRKTGGTLNGVIRGGVIDVHPENSGTILSYYTNDLAFLTQRGGSYIMTNTTTNTVLASSSNNNAATNMFDGSPSYYGFSVSAVTDTVVIVIKSPTAYSWSTNGGIGFGSATWRAKSVKIEMGYSATNKGTAQSPDSDIKWVTRINLTNNDNGIVYGNLSGPNAAQGGTSATTWSYMRLTLNNFNGTGPRIAQIFTVNYGSTGMHHTFLGLGGGTVYGNVDVKGNLTTGGKTVVTSVASGEGLTGGPITTSGTISHAVPSGAGAKPAGLYKVGTDKFGHVNSVSAVTKADITNLGIPGAAQPIKTLKTDNTAAQTTSANESIAGSGTINLHKVAKTGSYNDLNDKPDLSAYQPKGSYATLDENGKVPSSQLPSYVGTFVPYTGASKDVNLGNHSLFISDKTDYNGTMIKISGKGVSEDDVWTTIEPNKITMGNPGTYSSSISPSSLEVTNGGFAGAVKESGFKASYKNGESTQYSLYEYDGIEHNGKKLTLPEKVGTIALTSDLPTAISTSDLNAILV